MLNDLAALFADNLTALVGSVFVLGLMVGSFLERRYVSPSHHAGARLASSGGRIVAVGQQRRIRPLAPSGGPRTIQLEHPPLCLPRLQGAHQGLAKYSSGELARAAGALRLLQGQNIRTLSPGGTGDRLLSAGVAWHFGFGAPAACGLLFTWALIALTGIDIDHQLLPDGITLPLMWAGLLAALIVGPIAGSPIPVSARDALIGAMSGYVSLWLVFHAFRLITGKEGMGYGDFKLFAALGAWLGWKLLPLVILLSAATGALLGVLMIVLRGRDRAAPIPFGPYLAAAGWIAMMYGDSLVDGYLRVSGLRH